MKTGLTIAFSTGLVAAALQGQARAQDCEPSRAMVILDKSSSMQTGTIGGVTKWDIAKGALDTVVSEFETSLELGLMVFPNPDECSAGAVEVDPALNTAQSIRDVLATPPPTGGNYTPIAQTLSAAAATAALTDQAIPRYAILITDGWQWCDPYDASTRYDAVDTIEGLNGAGVTTYVVGFGDSVDASLLNQLAVAAGTGLPGCDPAGDTPTAENPCYYQADDPGELVGALMEIATTAAEETCDGVDNDCDGEVDEELTQDCTAACGDGTQTPGVQLCSGGTFAACTPADPTACDDGGGDDDGGEPTPEDPAAEDMDNGGMSAGCGCRAGSSGTPGALGLLAIALLALRRRRQH
ncbi:MAG TPA: vWA domain-containing protein [Kofleriaceae bacterium]|nr:vWA domain-containing protein [Kofleriaceae bacterium]